jgi:hypothetical protein
LEDVLSILSRPDTARDEPEQLVVQLAPGRLRSSYRCCPTHRQPHPPPVVRPQQLAFADGSQQDACWAGLQQDLSSLVSFVIVSVAGRSSAAPLSS